MPLPPPGRSAAALSAVIFAFLFLDLADMRPVHAWPFGLDSENAPNVAFASLLLFLAGVMALLHGMSVRGRLIPLLMSAIFFFMAYDEGFELHEELESRLGEDWQLLYLPVVIAFAVVWTLMLLSKMPGGSPRTLWILGAAAWLSSQVFESFQWDGDELIHPWMVIPEETLEMLGTAAWIIALLITVRATAARAGPANAR